jgi:hypothetical protein
MSNLIADIASDFKPPTGTTSVGQMVTTISTNAVYLAGLIFVGIIFFAGFKIISGAGNSDPQTASQGQKALTYAVVGFVIIFVAYWIVKILETLTGIKIF